jgi:hypothetical protein
MHMAAKAILELIMAFMGVHSIVGANTSPTCSSTLLPSDSSLSSSPTADEEAAARYWEEANDHLRGLGITFTIVGFAVGVTMLWLVTHPDVDDFSMCKKAVFCGVPDWMGCLAWVTTIAMFVKVVSAPKLVFANA